MLLIRSGDEDDVDHDEQQDGQGRSELDITGTSRAVL